MDILNSDLAEKALKIITLANAAKANAIEAIQAAKKANYEIAQEKLDLANKNFINCEKEHAELIIKEAAGEEIKISLLYMHAEDQMLTTQTIILFATEIIELYKLNKNKL